MKIDIRDEISPVIALSLVSNVILQGKISSGEHGKKYYCFCTTFTIQGEDIDVITRQYRKSDCFIVKKHIEYNGNIIFKEDEI